VRVAERAEEGTGSRSSKPAGAFFIHHKILASPNPVTSGRLCTKWWQDTLNCPAKDDKAFLQHYFKRSQSILRCFIKQIKALVDPLQRLLIHSCL